MNRIIPILPCPSIKEQVAFYKDLGFTILKTYNRPNPYAVVRYAALEIHFFGSKKTVPRENANMCFLEVEDVNRVYEMFTSRYKQIHGKVPRSGIPRISKLKDLAEDKRFIITDTGGNTLFVGTPNVESAEPAFYRTIGSETYSRHFEVLYDLVYSKEDYESANLMLVKLFPEDVTTIEASRSDLAKILLVALDIYLQRGETVPQSINDKLTEIFALSDLPKSDWEKLHKRYHDIINVE